VANRNVIADSIHVEIKDMNIQTLALNYSSFIYYEDAAGNPQELEQYNPILTVYG